jgi:hypothetical protein
MSLKGPKGKLSPKTEFGFQIKIKTGVQTNPKLKMMISNSEI